jgi:hypothetical protein
MRNVGIRKLGFMGGALLLLGAGAVSCKGCAKQETPHAEPEEESQHARLLARMADLKIDRTKVYPKDSSGVVACGEDTLCFVLQAETCVRATMTRKTTVSGYGMHDVVDADYAVTGPEAGQCRLTRHVRSADTHIDPRLVDALRAEGKSESDIAVLQTDTSSQLRDKNPPQLDCSFTNDDVLEVVLDLADGKFNDKLFRENCHEVEDAPRAAPTEEGEDNEAPGAAQPAPAPEPAAKPAAEPPAAAIKPGAEPKAKAGKGAAAAKIAADKAAAAVKTPAPAQPAATKP